MEEPTTEPRTDSDSPSPARAQTLPVFIPVPRERMRRGGWSAERQRHFIELLAETGSVRAACRRMGVSEHHIYKLRRHPEAESFRRAWEAALDCGIARIEDIAMDRAINGVKQPIVYHGEEVATRTVYNDRLLMFILKNRAPERFGTDGQTRRPDAVDQMKLERLKKQWRRQWEAEAAEQARAEGEAAIAGINAKLELMRQRHLAALTPRTRALAEDLARAEAEDLADYDARESHPLLPGVAWRKASGPEDAAEWDDEAEDAEWEDVE